MLRKSIKFIFYNVTHMYFDILWLSIGTVILL